MATIKAILHSDQVEASRLFLEEYRDQFPVVIDKHFLAVQFYPNFSSYPTVVAENVRGERKALSLTGMVTWSVVEDWLAEIDTEPQPAAPVPVTKFTKLEFLNRFTDQELVTLRGLEATEPAVAVFWEKFRVAEFIDVTDPRTIGGLNALESLGHLDEGRAAEILGEE